MAYGTAKVDVVQSSTAGTPPQFNDGNGTQTGTLCRAWVNFNGTGTVSIRSSFNVSSITDNGTGDYTVNFTTAMPDANYSIQATGQRAASNSALMGAITYNRTPTTTTAPVAFSEDGGSLQDPSICAVAIFR
jgi:hypothetical protein